MRKAFENENTFEFNKQAQYFKNFITVIRLTFRETVLKLIEPSTIYFLIIL